MVSKQRANFAFKKIGPGISENALRTKGNEENRCGDGSKGFFETVFHAKVLDEKIWRQFTEKQNQILVGADVRRLWLLK
jgi:hypothetical protein